jgi:glutamine amidotransferase
MIGIVDYGAGNLTSVRNAFARLGHDAAILSEPGAIDTVDRVVLPGVGSFKRAMSMLESGGWPAPLRAFAAGARPLLGICLGMQLLFDRGEDHGSTAGLGLVAGTVERLQPADGRKVPHVGWNSMTAARRHPLLDGVKAHIDFYFVHSFHCVPAREEDVLARSDYGGPFVAAVAHRNVAGFQFHPEKSQPGGLRILENFVEWDGGC